MLKDLIIPTKRNRYKPFFSARVAMVILTLWVLLLNSFSGLLISNFGVLATSLSEDRVIQLANEERTKRNLSTLRPNAYLSAAAHAKANNMFELQYWDHFGPNGESPWQFIKGAGYDYVYAGENLGKGFTTSEGVHQAWMASPTHKENILGANYEHIGIAIVSGVLDGEDVILVVQMFGSLSHLPTEETALIGAPEVKEEVKEVQKVVEVVEESKPVVRQEPQVIQGDSEDGRTKSIRIVYPEEDITYTNPQIPVKGETTYFDSGSLVEIITENSVIGETKVEDDNTWEFTNLHDWKEGRNDIDAVISFQSEKYRDSVSFFVNSSPPEILGVNVQKDGGNYEVIISVDDTADEVFLITGDRKIEGEMENSVAKIVFAAEELQDKIFLVVTDIHGNFLQEDITSKFFEEETKSKITVGGFLNFNISSVQRFVTVLLATLVLGLLLVQMYFYKKADRLKENSGDFLMVGIWWFIFLFGSFIGYSGSIY